MGLVEDVGALLQTAGRGTLGSTIFLGLMPEAPDAVVVVSEYAGNPPQLTGLTTPAVKEPGVQLRVRGTRTGYASARTLIENCWLDLIGLVDVSVSGTRYMAFEPASSPAYMARDQNERPEFVANFIAVIA